MSHSFEKPLKKYPTWELAVWNLSRIISNTIDGKLSNVITGTLNTSSASTTFSSRLCTQESHFSITPESADAASAMGSLYVKTKNDGSVVIAHGTTGTTQSYSLTIAIFS